MINANLRFTHIKAATKHSAAMQRAKADKNQPLYIYHNALRKGHMRAYVVCLRMANASPR
jgi:hypothetical protein